MTSRPMASVLKASAFHSKLARIATAKMTSGSTAAMAVLRVSDLRAITARYRTASMATIARTSQSSENATSVTAVVA